MWTSTRSSQSKYIIISSIHILCWFILSRGLINEILKLITILNINGPTLKLQILHKSKQLDVANLTESNNWTYYGSFLQQIIVFLVRLLGAKHGHHRAIRFGDWGQLPGQHRGHAQGLPPLAALEHAVLCSHKSENTFFVVKLSFTAAFCVVNKS